MINMDKILTEAHIIFYDKKGKKHYIPPTLNENLLNHLYWKDVSEKIKKKN